MMDSYRKTILLTGAGFTANFGGFLAREMWAKIFNNPKLASAGNLKLELRKNFNFETAYSTVLDSRNRFPDHEVEILEEVISEAYVAMDNVIKRPDCWQSSGIHPTDLGRFLNRFIEQQQDSVGISFTLNQDLFMERWYNWQPLAPKSLQYDGNFGNIDQKDIDSSNFKSLPKEEELTQYTSSFIGTPAYIKLHGSMKWVSDDGKQTKIIGINKPEEIARIPLLKWYFDIFQQALFRKDVKLVVIGYSFGDKHINDYIVKAINEYGLKLYIITTQDPETFYFNTHYKYPRGTIMNDQDEAKRPIWDAIEGYFPYPLKRIFPYSQSVTAEKSEVINSIGVMP